MLDVVDETFVLAPVSELREVFCDEKSWQAFGIELQCYEDRADLGKRWTLSGALTGTAEVWLEQAHGGVVVHVYVQADPTSRRSAARLRRRIARPIKQWVLDVKTGHDMARPAGTLTDGHAKIPAYGESTKER